MCLKVFIIYLVCVVNVRTGFVQRTNQSIIEEWAVEINGDQWIADLVAANSKFINKGKIEGFDNIYLFARNGSRRRSKREVNFVKNIFETDKRVKWAEHQNSLKREKREFARQSNSIHFNDDLWGSQWYLSNSQNYPYISHDTLRVIPVWQMGYTGKGVVVSVMDDGVERTHTDLAPNYDPLASYDFNDNDQDPTPRYNGQNMHGTRCAGEIAMVANNKKCGVGVAFEAKIGGIRLLDGRISDVIEGRSLVYQFQHIDIFSASWGPSDDGETMEGPKRLAFEALHRGVTFGRQGKGVIYVWASGNGGSKGDNCNCDGYVSSIYTLSIGSVTEEGLFPWYGEMCASTIAVAYSSGTFKEKKISTTDLYNKCTTEHTGTSAAAPLAAGLIALVLQANPRLTWRDVQHIVATKSEFEPLRNNKGWKRNAAGLMYNSKFGFGLLNAEAMVKAALKWTFVPPKTICTLKAKERLPRVIIAEEMTEVHFENDGCRFSPFEINIMEHVQVTASVVFPRRGFLSIYLQSPSGAVSMLLSQRPRDKSSNGFTNWTFTTVHFWGEQPRGLWKLIIKAKSGHNYIGNLTFASLSCHGTREIPEHLKHKRIYEDEELIPHIIDSTPEYGEANIYDQNSMINSLEPIPNLPNLYNWNDYGDSLIPVMNYNHNQQRTKNKVLLEFPDRLN